MNPYPARFLDLLPAAPVLDCGAGGRRLPGVITLDLAGRCSVRGDGLDLPFATDTFGVVLSQAVAEHVTDPQRLVDEMVRVLRPGGFLYIEAAFMQPVHLAPHHYFNITPHGMAHLCRAIETLDTGPTGTLAEVWVWAGRELGKSIPVPPAFRGVTIGTPGYENVSCGVYLLGRKP